MSNNLQRLKIWPLPFIPLSKSLKFPLYKGENLFFCKITQRKRHLRDIVIKFWNLAWIILISVSKKLSRNFEWLPLYWGKFSPCSPFSHFGREFPSIKWQPLKISKIGIDNFLETLIRMIHVKFQTSMTMLRRVDAFCVISQKKGFSPL